MFRSCPYWFWVIVVVKAECLFSVSGIVIHWSSDTLYRDLFECTNSFIPLGIALVLFMENILDRQLIL